jgi:hypothetical protein
MAVAEPGRDRRGGAERPDVLGERVDGFAFNLMLRTRPVEPTQVVAPACLDLEAAPRRSATSPQRFAHRRTARAEWRGKSLSLRRDGGGSGGWFQPRCGRQGSGKILCGSASAPGSGGNRRVRAMAACGNLRIPSAAPSAARRWPPQMLRAALSTVSMRQWVP